MPQYAVFTATFRPGQARAIDASVAEWMNLRVQDGFRYLDCRIVGIWDRSIDGPMVAIIIIMEGP